MDEDTVELFLDFETFNDLVESKKKFKKIRDIKIKEFDKYIDLDKITCFPNLESLFFEYGGSIQEKPWGRWDEDIIDIEDNFKWEENIIPFREMVDLGYEKFIPMKGILNLKKLEWIDFLVLEKFSDILKLPKLEYIHQLNVLECRYDDLKKMKQKEYEKLLETLSKIEIEQLRIRFFSGNISFLKFLNLKELNEIIIDVAFKLNDFDCNFINDARKDIGRNFFSINHFYTEQGGYITKQMIIENTKLEDKLRPKGDVYIKFIYEDPKETQGDVDSGYFNFPMIKNN